ncbi:MAG: hypothetical protein IPJ47_11730 [Anaerolineales bacterium]|nr:hypothetical protein [Anaerolineales bacterium]
MNTNLRADRAEKNDLAVWVTFFHIMPFDSVHNRIVLVELGIDRVMLGLVLSTEFLVLHRQSFSADGA